MKVNKVVISTPNGEEVLLDLTKDTVTPDTLADGETAHDASGDAIIGAAFGAILTVEEVFEGVKITATNKDSTSTAILKNGTDGTAVPMMTEDVAGIAKVGDNLCIDTAGRLSVVTTDTVEKDNTKPITSAAVHVVVGNIDVLLGTI